MLDIKTMIFETVEMLWLAATTLWHVWVLIIFLIIFGHYLDKWSKPKRKSKRRR